MKSTSLVAIVFLLLGVPCFGFQAQVAGWAVTNYHSDAEAPSGSENSIQVDVQLTFDEPIAHLVRTVDLRADGSTKRLQALVPDLKVESETELTVRFNKQNVYSEEDRFSIPAGACLVEIGLDDSRRLACPIVLSSPNDSQRLGSSFVSSQTPPNLVGPKSVRVLEVPDVKRLRWSNAELEIDFVLGDDMVFSGVVQIYDKMGASIGESPAFVDFKSGRPESFLNEGQPFRTKNQLNVVRIPAGKFTLRSKRTFSETVAILMIVTDGRQYVGSAVPTWDFMAARRATIVEDK